VQKCRVYDPMPKLGLKVPVPEMRPVSSSTETEPLILESGRSVRSARIRGLRVALRSAGVSGNVNRYSAVWLVTVASPRTFDVRLRAK
jgi:hypothetical protein